MARNSSGTIVAGLTAGAIIVVGILAYHASANAPINPNQAARPGASDSAKPKDKAKKEKSTAIPASSGTGRRVVYALSDKRVWLVGANEQAIRTYPIYPSSVSPAPGTYNVTSRSASVTGSDGVSIEHVVRFHTEGDIVFGFSAAVDGSTPDPDSSRRTGGIREKRADGAAMWTFASTGTEVVVVR
ncbi:hypothetical protein [Streptomyces buecherae]|uniref:L,D-transpeptidase n=1 Tax=Streptomyces buecherae TaxID=2763006 RepID=A0A7H8NBG6_9ACTN|nr:hypothetical protein [Streptomyces buecherae]QKW51850.1 hypothetical protein HUT08_22535 [Streptomyces buecherae]